MQPRFSQRAGGRMEVRLAREEVGLLRHLSEGLREVLGGEQADPALDRLFPAAYEAPEEDADWSGLTRSDLSTERLGRVEALVASLDRGRERRAGWTGDLGEEEVQAWLGVINDARLVVGVRLGATEEMHEDPPKPGDPRRPLFEVYTYLGALLSELLDAIDPGLSDALDQPE